MSDLRGDQVEDLEGGQEDQEDQEGSQEDQEEDQRHQGDQVYLQITSGSK